METEWIIGKKWWDSLELSMKEAAEEKKKLAIAQGSYHEDVPAITVIVDGKRTHKHSYNAKSGVGIIFGKQTSKILHLGVRNKFCWTCTRAQNIGESPTTHTCFKSWDGPFYLYSM